MKRIPILPLLVFSGLTLPGCASAPSEKPSPPPPNESAVPAGVDLQITSLTASCGTKWCWVRVAVSNEGSDAAEGINGGCVYSYGSSYDQTHPLMGDAGSRGLSFVRNGYLEGKSSAAYTGRFRPARRSSFHALDCAIDSNNVIPETNEGNNRRSTWINRGAGS